MKIECKLEGKKHDFGLKGAEASRKKKKKETKRERKKKSQGGAIEGNFIDCQPPQGIIVDP